MPEEFIVKCHCLRCGKDWFPRHFGRVPRCPKCRSPYWDKERTKPNVKGFFTKGHVKYMAHPKPDQTAQ
jgi:DNA-directed RNA polymerase subunit RPC12/RpoP